MTERLLTARELGELLALSAATVLDHFEAGKLPGFKLPTGPVRFRESEVLAWLEECRRGPSVTRSDAPVVTSCNGPGRGVSCRPCVM